MQQTFKKRMDSISFWFFRHRLNTLLPGLYAILPRTDTENHGWWNL